MTAGCPSDLALERHLLDRAASPLAGHLDACGRCRARVEEMEREGERFRRFVYPATVARVEEAARRGPRRWWLVALAPVPVVAALALGLALRAGPPPDDYVGTKGGGGLGLAAFTRGAGGAARAVEDGGGVGAGAALRLRIGASKPCGLFVLSIDGRGGVSRLDGAGADGLPVEAGPRDLPGGVQLDGVAGPERLFAVCAPEPGRLRWPDVEREARALAARGDASVRAATRLPGLPEGAVQATLLIEKGP